MKNEKILSSVYDFASILLTAVLTVSIIFTFFFKVSAVFGGSMENTLHTGDRLFISSVTTDIKYGDVVVVSQPNGYDEILVKRVIAVGGQTVRFDEENGTVSVDGNVLEEPYIKEPMIISDLFEAEYKVPEGMLFVMGDNRNWSADSRDKRVGFIDERYVMGRVIYRLGDTHLFNKELKNG